MYSSYIHVKTYYFQKPKQKPPGTRGYWYMHICMYIHTYISMYADTYEADGYYIKECYDNNQRLTCLHR